MNNTEMNTMAGLDKGEFRRKAEGRGSSSSSLSRPERRYIIQRRGCAEGMKIRMVSERNCSAIILGLEVPIYTPRRVVFGKLETKVLRQGVPSTGGIGTATAMAPNPCIHLTKSTRPENPTALNFDNGDLI